MQITNTLGTDYRPNYMTTRNSAEADWRDMTTKQWDEVIKNLDEYIDDYKAEMEYKHEMQIKAAGEAAMNAAANMRASAAGRATLMVAANGHKEMTSGDDLDGESIF